jgi:hypothetical protein
VNKYSLYVLSIPDVKLIEEDELAVCFDKNTRLPPKPDAIEPLSNIVEPLLINPII